AGRRAGGRRPRPAPPVLLAVGAVALRPAMHARGLQRGRGWPALARERQHRARRPPRREGAGSDGGRGSPGGLAAGHPARCERGDHARPTRARAGRRRARAGAHLPDARTRVPRPGLGPRHLEGRGRRRRCHLDAGGPRPDGPAASPRAAALSRTDRRRGRPRRARAARDRPARAVGVHVDPRPCSVRPPGSAPRAGPDGFILEGFGRLQRDAYHFLLDASWPKLLGILVSLYLAANALFAAAYLLQPGAIENARPGSFADAFFFSIQTMATIGYGKLAPGTTYANLLVVLETSTGILGLAMLTG